MFKQKILRVTLSGLAIAALVGCTTEPPKVTETPPAAPKPLVVATSDVLCDLTKQIAADTINLKCLVAPGTDPHTYKATPEDIKAIADSQLILYNGFNFETTLIKAIEADQGGAKKVAVGEVAVPKPLMGKHDHGKKGHDHHKKGHDHDKDEIVADPHIWHNAANGQKIVAVISRELQALQPDQAQFYSKNEQKITSELAALHSWIKAQIATIPPAQRKLVTTHHALGYYAQAYNISIKGALQGLSTAEKATPARVTSLVDTIKASQVPTIFAESSINPKLIEAVAREAQIKVSSLPLFVDGLGAGDSNAATYQTMLVANTQAIVQGLGGNFVPFKP